MRWKPREQRQSGPRMRLKQEAAGAARAGAAPLQNNSRQWLLEHRQLEATGAARVSGCWSSLGRMLPELPETWL